MSWMMSSDGWRCDINEGPYNELQIKNGWEIFQLNSKTPVRLASPKGVVTEHMTIQAAKLAAQTQ